MRISQNPQCLLLRGVAVDIAATCPSPGSATVGCSPLPMHATRVESVTNEGDRGGCFRQRRGRGRTARAATDDGLTSTFRRMAGSTIETRSPELILTSGMSGPCLSVPAVSRLSGHGDGPRVLSATTTMWGASSVIAGGSAGAYLSVCIATMSSCRSPLYKGAHGDVVAYQG